MTLKTPSTSGIRTLARVLMHDMHSGRSVIRAVTIAVLSGTVPPRDAARRRSGALLVLPRIAAMPRAVGRKKYLLAFAALRVAMRRDTNALRGLPVISTRAMH